MESGQNKKTRSNEEKLFVYISKELHRKIHEYVKHNHMSLSQLTREALTLRMDASEAYNDGFNAGLNQAMVIAHDTKGSGMMFPSGKTWATAVCDDIELFIRGRNDRP